MRVIALTQGKVALVDDEDYECLMAMGSWCAVIRSSGWRAQTQHNGKLQYMHRIILDAPSNLEVDHINHDTLDNRRCNIRLCTRSQNMQNQRKSSGKSSKYKGVSWSGGGIGIGKHRLRLTERRNILGILKERKMLQGPMMKRRDNSLASSLFLMR